MAVTPAMIATALGVAAPDSGSTTEAQWELWISDALMLIETRKAQLDITDDLDAAKVDYVVRQAVVAHVQRPDNATQVTTAVDDASTSRTYKSGAGRVAILDEWWTLLGLTAPTGGAYAVNLLGAANIHLPWCSLYFNADYCSCGVDIAGYPIFETGGA